MLPAFFSEVHNYDIAQIGVFIFFAKLLDIFSDPVLGWINDKRFVARKILVVIGSIVSGIALSKLFLLDNVPYENYLFVWITILYLGWTIFQIPYLSLGYDLERNYFLRTKLSASREFFILLGLFFSLGMPMLFHFSNEELLKYLVYIALITGLIGVSLLIFFIPEKKSKRKEIMPLKILTNMKNNSPLVKIMTIWLINSIANVLPMILFAFFITYVLGGDDFSRQKVLFFYFLSALLGIPFWTILSKKIQKTKTWSLSLFSSAFFFIFVLFLNDGDMLAFILISCLTGFCLGADLILPPSIQADLTDLHKEKFKEDISGILFSMITFINKFSFAISSIFVFGILGLMDFKPNQNINNESKKFITISYALIPILMKIFAGYFLVKFKLDEVKLRKIQKKIYG